MIRCERHSTQCLPAGEFLGLIVSGVVLIALAFLPWAPSFTQPIHSPSTLGAAFEGVLTMLFSGAMTLIGVALIVAAVFLRRGSIREANSETPS